MLSIPIKIEKIRISSDCPSYLSFFDKRKPASGRPEAFFLCIIEKVVVCVWKIESFCYIREARDFLFLCKIREKVRGNGG